MIDVLSADAQLLHQLDHRDHVTRRTDAIRTADPDHVRLAALGAQLLRKLDQLRGAIRAINPVFPGAEKVVEQKISVWHVRFLAVQNQIALESGLRRRRRGLAAMI